MKNIPPEMDLIGVNRSYEIAYAPRWCTIDYVAFKTAYEHWESGRYKVPDQIFCHKNAVTRRGMPTPPSQTTILDTFPGHFSGDLAMYVALELLKYDRVHLVGFDVWSENYFYGANKGFISEARRVQRKNLWKHRDDPRIYLGSVPLSKMITWDKAGIHV